MLLPLAHLLLRLLVLHGTFTPSYSGRTKTTAIVRHNPPQEARAHHPRGPNAPRTRARAAARTPVHKMPAFVAWFPEPDLTVKGLPMNPLPEKRMALVDGSHFGKPRPLPEDNLHIAARDMACLHLNAYANDVLKRKVNFIPQSCGQRKIRWSADLEFQMGIVTAFFASSKGDEKICCVTAVKPSAEFALCAWTKCYPAEEGMTYEESEKPYCYAPSATYSSIPEDVYKNCLVRITAP